jgi:hypothetical protein
MAVSIASYKNVGWFVSQSFCFLCAVASDPSASEPPEPIAQYGVHLLMPSVLLMLNALPCVTILVLSLVVLLHHL